MKWYWVYILASRSRALYTGVTNNLEFRLWQHRNGEGSIHATEYRIHRLVYYEVYTDIREAIAREKQIKSWRREKKVRLIEKNNPWWEDLCPERANQD